VVVGPKDYNDTLSNKNDDYIPLIRGRQVAPQCNGTEDIKGTNLKIIKFQLDPHEEWTELTYNIETPIAGEHPSKNVDFYRVEPMSSFTSEYIESIDISNTWYESDSGEAGTWKAISIDDTFKKDKYYKTMAPKVIKNAILDDFYKAYSWIYQSDSAYGISDSVQFTINGITCKGLYESKWRTNPLETGEYIDSDGSFCFGAASEIIRRVDVSGFELPVDGAAIKTTASIASGSPYSITEDYAGVMIHWYDITDGNENIMNLGDKFVAGNTYKAVFTVYKKGNAKFKLYSYVSLYINGEYMGQSKQNASEQSSLFIVEYTCPTIGIDESITISGVKTPYEGVGGDLDVNSDNWEIDDSNKFYIYHPYWCSVESDGTIKQIFNDKKIDANKKIALCYYLNSKNGYKFPESYQQLNQIKIYVDGAERTYIKKRMSDDELYVISEFTAKEAIKEIKLYGSLKLSAGSKNYYDGFKSDEPSNYDIYTTNSDYIKNGILWSVKDGSNYISKKVNEPITFENNKEYAITLYVKATDGQKFISDVDRIAATIDGKKASVEVSEGGGGDVLAITVSTVAKNPVSAVYYTIPEPKIGDKPGKMTYTTVPDKALKNYTPFDTSNNWQVSDDGITYTNMSSGATFEAGKYYRTSVATLHYAIVILLNSYIGDIFDANVTYGLGDDVKVFINNKSISEEGTLVDGYYNVGQLLIDLNSAEITGIKDQIYTGKDITQSLKVKLGETELKEGTDYTVTYKDNIEVGEASLIVTGKGIYSGNVTKTFKIIAKEDKQQVPTEDNASKPTDKSETSKPSNTPDDEEEGVGKISQDGKILTDPDGVKFKVSDKVTNSQLKKNTKIADKKSGGKYRITKVVKKNGKVVGGTVEYMAPYNKNTKLISATGKVKLAGVTFTVTSISQNCGKGCKNLSKVVIGDNVTNIGKNAFNGCDKLKTINIKSKKLKKVGANAFKGINKKATISVPKAKKKAYTKLLKGKGQAKTVKIK
jgi:hypothetical protein